MTASTALGAGLRGVHQGDVKNKVWGSIHPLQHRYDGEQRIRVMAPRGGFGAELSSSVSFFGSRSDFFLGFALWTFFGFHLGEGLIAAGRVRRNFEGCREGSAKFL